MTAGGAAGKKRRGRGRRTRQWRHGGGKDATRPAFANGHSHGSGVKIGSKIYIYKIYGHRLVMFSPCVPIWGAKQWKCVVKWPITYLYVTYMIIHYCVPDLNFWIRFVASNIFCRNLPWKKRSCSYFAHRRKKFSHVDNFYGYGWLWIACRFQVFSALTPDPLSDN